MLVQVSPSPERQGIARLAAAAPLLRRKCRVEYFELPTRRWITRCRSDRVPFDWTVNPYRGCEFGCKYCYARYTHEFMELDPADFERRIFAKAWDPGSFRHELCRIPAGDWIAIGTATDAYQPAERRFGITRRLLEVLAAESGRKISLTTKSDLAVRDIDLLQRISRRNILHLAVSITTADSRLARLLEPYAPAPERRFEAVRRLSRAGLPVAVLACPLLPHLTDSERMLDRLAEMAAEAGAAAFAGGPVFLKPCSQGVFFSFLERHFPNIICHYRRDFARRAFLPNSYVEQLASRLERIRRRHGLRKRIPDSPPPEWAFGDQLRLPFMLPRGAEYSLTKSACRKYAASL